ncbi:MAG: aminotransferase class V-fold PLP-dependent enzyme [Alphaproteobacteria bacterium]
MINRRHVLEGAAGLAASSLASQPLMASATPQVAPTGARPSAEMLASDEAFWRGIAALYETTDDIVNLENGNWGLMAQPVLERYLALTRMVNRQNSYYARRAYGPDVLAARARVAATLGAGEDEIVFTRGATEALKGIIGGYSKLKPGDAVMYADLDYGSIQASMDWLAARDGASVVRLEVPEPATHDGLIDFYTDALKANPAVRLLLLTHVSHRTGLVIPVKAITAAARALGVDVVVDAAHSWGQIDFRIDDLGADFVGFNLHKWIGAPVGVGLAYIRRERLADIAPDMASGAWEQDRISGRVHTGTANFAAILAVPHALDFHDRVGPARKEARVRHLRTLWVDAARGIPGLQILTPEDPRLHAGITSFRFAGQGSVEANKAIAARLLDEHSIFTVHRSGVAAGACIRVTPSLYNSAADVQRLVPALAAIGQSL